MAQFGYFVTESSEHFSEYVPWFIKSGQPELLDRFAIPLDEYRTRCEEQIADWAKQLQEFCTADRIEVGHSREYASDIVNSVWTGTRSAIYGNVPNEGLLPALPTGCSVEVPCTVDGTGIHPAHIGSIPPQLSALMRTNVNVQELTVKALLEESRDHIYHAAMLDPHTAAELSLEQIRSMVDDMLCAHEEFLPAWMSG